MLSSPVAAAGPDVATIVQHMKQGLQGPNDAVRLMTLKVISDGKPAAEWKLVQANGNAKAAHWILTVVLAPPDAKGMAFLNRNSRVRPRRSNMLTFPLRDVSSSSHR